MDKRVYSGEMEGRNAQSTPNDTARTKKSETRSKDLDHQQAGSRL
ncbi:MAG: hypothetical protein ACW98F_14040 [Candidatus Hodarchaeales archaeon]